MRKYRLKYLVSLASRLIEGVKLSDYRTWGKPGIRAQLLDKEKRTLVMDFCLEGDQHSLHILNAVSPAFTCALSFTRHVCEEIDRLMR
jgi:L-2-hydroxyglutarate oxidase LhgO